MPFWTLITEKESNIRNWRIVIRKRKSNQKDLCHKNIFALHNLTNAHFWNSNGEDVLRCCLSYILFQTMWVSSFSRKKEVCEKKKQIKTGRLWGKKKRTRISLFDWNCFVLFLFNNVTDNEARKEEACGKRKQKKKKKKEKKKKKNPTNQPKKINFYFLLLGDISFSFFFFFLLFNIYLFHLP